MRLKFFSSVPNSLLERYIRSIFPQEFSRGVFEYEVGDFSLSFCPISILPAIEEGASKNEALKRSMDEMMQNSAEELENLYRLHQCPDSSDCVSVYLATNIMLRNPEGRMSWAPKSVDEFRDIFDSFPTDTPFWYAISFSIWCQMFTSSYIMAYDNFGKRSGNANPLNGMAKHDMLVSFLQSSVSVTSGVDEFGCSALCSYLEAHLRSLHAYGVSMN